MYIYREIPYSFTCIALSHDFPWYEAGSPSTEPGRPRFESIAANQPPGKEVNRTTKGKHRGDRFFRRFWFFFVLSWVYDRYIEHDRTSCGRMLSGELRLRNQLGATTLHERSWWIGFPCFGQVPVAVETCAHLTCALQLAVRFQHRNERRKGSTTTTGREIWVYLKMGYPQKLPFKRKNKQLQSLGSSGSSPFSDKAMILVIQILMKSTLYAQFFLP